jgi:acyl carrier protein
MDRNELGKVLMELVEQETGEKCPDLDDSTDLRTGLNLDSLDMVSLVFRMENRLRVEIKSEELGGLVTAGDLLDLLASKVASTAVRQAA